MRSLVFSPSGPLVSVLILLSLLGLACTGGFTGGVDKAIANADRSDPIRAAIVEALAAAEQDFAPILGEPFSPDDQKVMIDNWLEFSGMEQAMSSMDLLRAAEIAATSSRHVNVDMPGASARYWEQEIVSGGVQSNQKYVSWSFPVPFSERKQVQADLVSRIAPIFAVDPKWTSSTVSDPKVNPIAASTSYFLYLSMGLDASSESIMVSVEYFHDQEGYEAMGGVRVYVLKMLAGTP